MKIVSRSAAVRLDGVTKAFGKTIAVDAVTLDIEAGTLVTLLGPSGCGKTTTLRMIAGLETQTSGHVLIGGKDVTLLPPNERDVSMVFQSYALFPHMTVEGNVGYGLKHDSMSGGERRDRVKAMLDLVQLTPLAKRKPHQLSGGQRQRVALARALAKQPKLLLLDEPLGALDKRLRQQAQFELMRIQETTGTTFIIVTHDQEEAMTVASRVAVMDHGKMIQVDTPDRIYETPNSVYVAAFIGDVNIIEGRAVRKGDDKYAIAWAEGQPDIIGTSSATIDQGTKVHFAIRPEKVAIASERPEGRANVIEGKVSDIAYLGNISTYKVEVAGGRMIKAQVANERRIARRDITWDDPVFLSFTDTAGVLLLH